MKELISPFQNAFLGDMQLQDNVIVGFEILNTIWKERKGGSILGGLTLGMNKVKLGFHKRRRLCIWV